MVEEQTVTSPVGPGAGGQMASGVVWEAPGHGPDSPDHSHHIANRSPVDSRPDRTHQKSELDVTCNRYHFGEPYLEITS